MREGLAMRVLLAFFAAAAAAPAAAQLAMPPGEIDRPPSRLAPIGQSSPWYERLAQAGQAVAMTLGRGPNSGWEANFGGQWLAAADRTRIAALIADDALSFHRILARAKAYEQVVLGWQPAEGSGAYAALADRPEADAIICWRAAASGTAWPTTLAEAEDRARHACVRVSYSMRFGTPQWRAFIDPPVAVAN